jgi:hypothetical protein
VLFSKDVVFVHIPKTGGTSVTRYLLDVLPKPVYMYSSPERAWDLPPEVLHVRQGLHQSMAQTAEILTTHGLRIEEIPLILAVIRSPYEIAVSWYSYVQTEDPVDEGPIGRIARNTDFEKFVTTLHERFGTHSFVKFERFLQIDGQLPANLRIVRYENLADGVRDALTSIGIQAEAPFPWLNPSDHGPLSEYYTPAAEEAVYESYQWVFDQGFYPRLDLESLQAAPYDAALTNSREAALEPLRRHVGRRRAQKAYEHMRTPIGDALSRVIPAGETVVVVSKGDDSLLDIEGRRGVHFPQSETGEYAGHYPATGTEVVAQLQGLQEKGAGYLLIPQPSIWWLDSYPELDEYLQTKGEGLWADEHCRIYALTASGLGQARSSLALRT